MQRRVRIACACIAVHCCSLRLWQQADNDAVMSSARRQVLGVWLAAGGRARHPGMAACVCLCVCVPQPASRQPALSLL
ncbi:hypothetical protein BC831DRAFT_444877, partial [Entophlyctis helioformis]